MASEALSMEEKLAQLRAQYAAKINERTDHLEQILNRLSEADDAECRGIFIEVRDVTHKLAGSGATFGFPGVTTAARAMEHACIAFLDDHDSDRSALEQNLSRLCADLKNATQAPVADPWSEMIAGTPNPATRDKLPELHDSARLKVLIIMEYDAQTLSRVQLEMDHFGFAARIIDHPAKIHADIEQNGPVDVIVTGMLFDGDEEAAAKELSKFRENKQNREIPIVVHTWLDSIEARLSAVRFGSKAYLVKPVDFPDLVASLDQVIADNDDEPFRVLIVDDDESLARHTEAVLQGAGMTTEVVLEPLRIFEVMDEFSPELILLDLYMPEADGQEIAAVLRQREEYAGIPIVFLSGEVDKDKQLLAMELGGDDFLTKPIRPPHLISSVRIRAGRFRSLRSFMVSDSMTGLYNHTTTKQMLQNELSRRKRTHGEMVLATVDIDHFKNVNDTYGHGVGDRVIKALARLMRQRLRSSDIIGRMGGEEFSAIMPDTGIDEAEGVFNQIRTAFSEIVFHTDEQSFNVTLSCGLADYPRYDTAPTLSDAADKALYRAKDAGRNRVIKA